MLAQTTTASRLKTVFRKPWRQALLLAAGLMFLALGIVLTASAFADYEDVVANEDILDLPKKEQQLDVIFMVLGVFFTIFGFVLLGKCENVIVTNIILHNYCNLFRIVYKSG